jgi:hypothetical protein
MSKARRVYLKAAELINTRKETYSCHAVRHAEHGHYSTPTKLENFYRATMGFRHIPVYVRDDFLLALHAHAGEHPHENILVVLRELRVWLLCMMAAACDDLEEKA